MDRCYVVNAPGKIMLLALILQSLATRSSTWTGALCTTQTVPQSCDDGLMVVTCFRQQYGPFVFGCTVADTGTILHSYLTNDPPCAKDMLPREYGHYPHHIFSQPMTRKASCSRLRSRHPSSVPSSVHSCQCFFVAYLLSDLLLVE